MKGYLQSTDRAKERLCIGPDESSIAQIAEPVSSELPLVGSYSSVAGERVLFYRWQGVLRLRFGNAAPLSLQGVEADWSACSGLVSFKLKSGDRTILAHSYSGSKELTSLPEDPTPFVEAEDFDFLLFVRNVLSDRARASRIYTVQ